MLSTTIGNGEGEVPAQCSVQWSMFNKLPFIKHTHGIGDNVTVTEGLLFGCRFSYVGIVLRFPKSASMSVSRVVSFSVEFTDVGHNTVHSIQFQLKIIHLHMNVPSINIFSKAQQVNVSSEYATIFVLIFQYNIIWEVRKLNQVFPITFQYVYIVYLPVDFEVAIYFKSSCLV